MQQRADDTEFVKATSWMETEGIHARDVTDELWHIISTTETTAEFRKQIEDWRRRLWPYAASRYEVCDPAVLLSMTFDDEMSSDPIKAEAARLVSRTIKETADPKLKAHRILMEMRCDAFGRPMKDGKLVYPEDK